MQVCTSLPTDNHASTTPLGFLQAGCPSCRPTNSVLALKSTDQATAVKDGAKFVMVNAACLVVSRYLLPPDPPANLTPHTPPHFHCLPFPVLPGQIGVSRADKLGDSSLSVSRLERRAAARLTWRELRDLFSKSIRFGRLGPTRRAA